jgi:hypothetical protein
MRFTGSFDGAQFNESKPDLVILKKLPCEIYVSFLAGDLEIGDNMVLSLQAIW